MNILNLEELEGRQKKLFDTSVFLGKLLLAGVVFRAILYVEPSTLELQRGLAQLTSVILTFLGYNSSLENITVLVGSNAYIITQDCLGWKSVAAFLGLSFASNSLRRKYNLVALGILGLIMANIARIVTTIILSQSGWVSFEFIHSILWRWLLTGIVLITWVSVIKSQQISELFAESKAKRWLKGFI